MTQARLSFSNDDAARTLDVAPSVPSRAGRQLPRKDYAQMHSGGPAPAASQKCPCGRSGFSLPTNRRAPTRQRSLLTPSSQDAIELLDSISQVTTGSWYNEKTWKKKPRRVRSAFRSKYLSRVGCSISDIWFKSICRSVLRVSNLNKILVC
jgi:hypothetical protein